MTVENRVGDSVQGHILDLSPRGDKYKDKKLGDMQLTEEIFMSELKFDKKNIESVLLQVLLYMKMVKS